MLFRSIGSFTAKLDYKMATEMCFLESKKWWWDYLWKTLVPLKCKIVLWLALNNKLLLWKIGIKRGWRAPSRCALFKSHEESFSHLFVSFPCATQVWDAVTKEINPRMKWKLPTMEENVYLWFQDATTYSFKAFIVSSFIVFGGIETQASSKILAFKLAR